jgi:hypothetical protein
MSIRKLHVTLIPLDEHSLADFAKARPLPGERSIKATRLTQLKKLIKGGKFLGLEWHRGKCLADDQVYRFDGQHTTRLLQTLWEQPDPDIPFPTGAPITLTDWTFDSVEDDAPQVFDSFNNPLSARSSVDILEGYQARYPELKDLDPTFLMKALNGMTFYEKQQHDLLAKKNQAKGLKTKPLFAVAHRNIGVRLDEPVRRQFIVWLQQLRAALADKPRAIRLFRAYLSKSGLVAHIYSGWRENATIAQQFWTTVMTESAPDPDDETRQFAEELKRLNSATKKVKPSRFYTTAATAWKRYKAALTTTLETPKTIETTDTPMMPIVSSPEPPTDHASA